MGNDMRNVSQDSQAILKNKDAIAVSQDPLGQMGIRLTGERRHNPVTQTIQRVV